MCHYSFIGQKDGVLFITEKPATDGTTTLSSTTTAADDEQSAMYNILHRIQLPHGIKALAVDPLEQYLAVSTDDGHVTIIDITLSVLKNSAPLQLTTTFTKNTKIPSSPNRTGTITTIKEGEHEFPIVWHPQGDVLAYASQVGVCIVRRSSWETVYDLPLTTSNPNSCNALSWSTNGRYLCAVDTYRFLRIWDMTVGDIKPTLSDQNNSSVPLIPTIATDGYVREMIETDDDAVYSSQISSTTNQVSSKVSPSSASYRIQSIAWVKDGKCIVFVDDRGTIGAVKVNHLNAYGSIVDKVESFSWPLIMGTTSQSHPSSGVASNKDSLMSADNSSKTKSFVDNEAMESDTEDQITKVLETTTAVTKKSTESMVEDGPLEVSLSAEKRAHGFIDGDGSDEETGGIRKVTDFTTYLSTNTYNAPKINMAEIFSKLSSKLYRDLEDRLGLVPPQPAFQSGSTRYTRSKGARVTGKRYLIWNGIGAITSRKEGPTTTISIEFSDTSLHRRVPMEDTYGYTMASLNEQAAVLASPYIPPASDRDRATENGQPATLAFRAFGSYGSNNSTLWVMQFPVRDARRPASTFSTRAQSALGLRTLLDEEENEEQEDEELDEDGKPIESVENGDTTTARNKSLKIEDDLLDTAEVAESPVAVVVGDSWLAAATDWQRLYFIRSGKSQDAVINVPGPVVTLAGRGALCAIAYHRTSPSSHTQHIAIDVYLYRTFPTDHLSIPNVKTSLPQLLRTVDLPLPPNTHLTWMDFSTTGMLMTMDSDGILRALQPGFNWTWTIFCDTHSNLGKMESLWPVSVTLSPQEALRKDPMNLSADPSVKCFPNDGLVPVLFGVVLKGSTKQPMVTTPRPLCTPFPLRIPMLDTGDLSIFDDSFVRAELMRVHHCWCDSVGISYSNEWPTTGMSGYGASSYSLQAAMTAASALQRGIAAQDAASELEIARSSSIKTEMKEALAMDKMLLRNIQIMCEKDDAVSAVQLATRLHVDKSLDFASRIAMNANRPAVSERVVQLMLIQQQQAQQQAMNAIMVNNSNHSTVLTPAVRHSNTSLTTEESTSSTSSSKEDNRSRVPGATPGSTYSNDNSLRKSLVSSKTSSTASTTATTTLSSSTGINPFAKKTFSSPSRKRKEYDELQTLTVESPLKDTIALSRQSSFASEARMKRLRELNV